MFSGSSSSSSMPGELVGQLSGDVVLVSVLSSLGRAAGLLLEKKDREDMESVFTHEKTETFDL